MTRDVILIKNAVPINQFKFEGGRTLGRGTLGRGTLGREWKTRVDSRSGDLHWLDSRSGASLLNMNCSIGREITRGWTLGRELLNLT